MRSCTGRRSPSCAASRAPTAERHEREQALARLDGVEDRISTLTADVLDHVEHDLDAASGGYDPRRSELPRQVEARRQQLTPGSD